MGDRALAMIALVLGGAVNVWEDARTAQALVPSAPVIAVNDMIPRWEGPLVAAASVHAEKIQGWISNRRSNGRPDADRVFTMRDDRRPSLAEAVDHHFAGQTARGSSGLFAVKVALEEMKFSGVILCGVGMDAGPHFVRGGEWRSARRYRLGWEQAVPHIRYRVRSMSGWTCERLGAPDLEWVERHGCV